VAGVSCSLRAIDTELNRRIGFKLSADRCARRQSLGASERCRVRNNKDLIWLEKEGIYKRGNSSTSRSHCATTSTAGGYCRWFWSGFSEDPYCQSQILQTGTETVPRPWIQRLVPPPVEPAMPLLPFAIHQLPHVPLEYKSTICPLCFVQRARWDRSRSSRNSVGLIRHYLEQAPRFRGCWSGCESLRGLRARPTVVPLER
jgi:hypothetical protein